MRNLREQATQPQVMKTADESRFLAIAAHPLITDLTPQFPH